MNIVEEKTTYLVESSRPKFKVTAENGEVKSVDIYENGDYKEVVYLDKSKLEDIVVILLSEYLKLDCSNYLQLADKES